MRLWLLLAVLALGSGTARSQGCTQCRDNTAATPPATQQAYRRAIGMMVVAAGGLFVGGVALIRREW